MSGLKILAFWVGLGALYGCGGSGSITDPVFPTSAQRANVVGDSWTYSVTADVPLAGRATGTYSEALSADTLNGQASVKDSEVFNLKASLGPIILASFTETGADGQVEVVDGGSTTFVSSNTFSLPGQITATTDVKGTLTLSDGTTLDETYKVVGTERLFTAAGEFDCWIVKETIVHNNGTKDFFTLDVAPEIGNWVRSQAETDYSGGQVFKWTAILTSIVTPSNGSVAVAHSGFLISPTLETLSGK